MPTAQVMAVMRSCGPDLGLSAQVLRTLEVLLSCLAPKRNHHVVFASNRTLTLRSGGLSERSLRRHISQLTELGLVERADSANGKRYSRHDPLAGMTLRFGLDFACLFQRLKGLSALADAADQRNQRLLYLRCKLRAACQRILRAEVTNETALAFQKAARRKLTIDEYEAMLDQLPMVTESPEVRPATVESSASGGQNDRHQSNLSTELIDKVSPAEVAALLDHCTEAQSFAENRIDSHAEIVRHAEQLAPMIGIPGDLWLKACEKQRQFDLAALIWLMVQNLGHIQKPAAYFQAVTIGEKAKSFAPWKWLQRQRQKIVRGQQRDSGPLSADNLYAAP